tara:strand:- start:365 stop:703 length:339 start_codon:yes stop_codon:yes gene_type:complete
MGEYNEAQVWSVITGKNHPSLVGDERTISGYMHLVGDLFPGINYYSVTGFNQVVTDYAQPVLRKLFPDLVDKPADDVSGDVTLAIGEFLPSDGYQHEDDPAWLGQLEELLAA